MGIYLYPEETGFLGAHGPKFQICVLYSRDEGDHQFWETVMVNRGALAKVFREEQEALEWFGVRA